MNEKFLNKNYDDNINKLSLTTMQLHEYGFNSNDLNQLMENGILKKLEANLYLLKSIDKLYDYGKQMLLEKKMHKAILCFKTCYELDPNHLGACFQLFLKGIQKYDFEKVFELYDKLLSSDNEYYLIDNNYYLYLLSIITDVPNKYKTKLQNLKLEDIMIPSSDTRFQNIPLQNKIRLAAWKRKFPYVFKQMNDLIKNQNYTLTSRDILAKVLISQAINVEKYSQEVIFNLAKEKKYIELNNYLIDKKQKHGLSIIETYYLKLVNSLIEIKATHNIPTKNIMKKKHLFEAINSNNYKEALKLNKIFNEQNNILNETSTLTLLLEDIWSLILEISKTKLSENIVNENEEDYINLDFNKIFNLLINNDYDNALHNLKKYLQIIKKSQYEFLIINLIKISLLEHDLTFSKPKMVLMSMKLNKDEYKFNILTYAQEFYKSMSKHEFEEAKIYLDIIETANKLGYEYELNSNILQLLKQPQKLIEDNKKVIVDKNNNLVNNLSDIKSNTVNTEKTDTIKQYVKKLHDTLIIQKGIIVLKPMDEVKINNILFFIKDYPDMKAFTIGSKKKQLVLKYKIATHEQFNIKELYYLGNKCFREKKYQKCIEYYTQLLHIFNNPKSNIYTKLGLAYLRTNNKSAAIDYLTIATEKSKEDGNGFDFTELLYSLKGMSDSNDAKPKVMMSEDEFDYNDMDNYYGIEDFEKINDYIINSGLGVENACLELNLTIEQIALIKIIYARMFYSQGEITKGDLFLNSVEKSKGKTKKVISLLNQIRKNKRFYQNREMNSDKKLNLSLVPKK